MKQWVGVTRLVYNLCLEQRRDHWRQYLRQTGRPLTWAQQSLEVTQLRREFDFIGTVPRVILEQAVRDLDKAFRAFFSGRAKHPKPRRIGYNDSVRFQGCVVGVQQQSERWGALRLPLLGHVKYRSTRPLPTAFKNATVSRVAGQWFVSFIAEAPEVESAASGAVGIDRGVANTLTLSTGEHIRVPDVSRLERRRRRAQRVLARRKKGSRRYAAQRAKAARLTAKIARARRHRLHEASTAVARRFSLVAIEALNIANMTASAKGSAETPGRNVRQKAGLNRSILHQGWGIFAGQLAYKLEAAGGRLIQVPAAFTSQTCQACGVIDARSRKSQAVFDCVHCGHRDHADVNAALEILRRSTAWLGVEEGQLRPSREAPTSAA